MPAIYLFRCPTCGNRQALFRPDPDTCEHCGTDRMVRDYRSEGVTANTAALARERGGQDNGWFRENFLPTAKDYAGPTDPDGTKGLQKWNDEHGPRDDNHNPVRPEVPKRVF